MAYTDSGLRERLKRAIMAETVAGTLAGQWSARKAQLLRHRYEAAMKKRGLPPYSGPKTAAQRDLSEWTRQRWGTMSGRPSNSLVNPDARDERYLPAAKLSKTSLDYYTATSAKKRTDRMAGKQHSRQPSRQSKL